MVKRLFSFLISLLIIGALHAESGKSTQVFFDDANAENEYSPYVTLNETFAIDEAIGLALNNNPDLQTQKAALLRASGALRQAQGYFDIKVGAESSYNVTYTPMDPKNPSGHSGDDILYQTIYGQELTSKAYVEKLFAFGVNARLNYQLQRTKQQYKDGIYELDNYYASYGHPNYNNTGTVSLEVSIPLLKGFNNAIADKNLELAKLNYEGMTQNMEDAMAKVVMQTSENYWKLYIAYEKVLQLEKILESNKTRLANVERLVKAGVRTKNDELRLKVNLLDMQRQLETAKIDYGTAKVNLAIQIGIPVEKITRPAVSLPEVEFEGDFPSLEEYNREKLTKIAFNRPDIISLVKVRDSAELKVKNAKTGTLPDLDLKLNIGTNGTKYGRPAEDYLTAANHNVRKMNYGGAIIFSMPLQNNSKKGELLAAEAELAEAEAKLNKQKNIFILQLMNAISALNSYRDTVKDAKNVLELQKEVYSNEQRRYEGGISSVDNLIQQDANWLEANINFYQIYETYLKYIMEYKYYTTGLITVDSRAETLYNLQKEEPVAEESDTEDVNTEDVNTEDVNTEEVVEVTVAEEASLEATPVEEATDAAVTNETEKVDVDE